MINEYIINFMIFILIYIIIVISFNLTFGFTGLVNLGHMVFFGIGAYTSAILTLNGVPWYFALILAGIITSIIGAAIAMITARLKGDYFQIVTLGLVFIAITISRNWISLTRGALGLPGIPPILKNNFYYMMFVFAIAAMSLLFFYWLTNSETGKIFQAIRDDETATAVLGKNTYAYKVLSISISTFFAGVAGSLYAHFIKFVDTTIFDLGFFILILSMLITGGLASITGSIAGVVVISVFTEVVRYISVNPEIIGAAREMAFMGIIILILIYKPRGMMGRVDI